MNDAGGDPEAAAAKCSFLAAAVDLDAVLDDLEKEHETEVKDKDSKDDAGRKKTYEVAEVEEESRQEADDLVTNGIQHECAVPNGSLIDIPEEGQTAVSNYDNGAPLPVETVKENAENAQNVDVSADMTQDPQVVPADTDVKQTESPGGTSHGSSGDNFVSIYDARVDAAGAEKFPEEDEEHEVEGGVLEGGGARPKSQAPFSDGTPVRAAEQSVSEFQPAESVQSVQDLNEGHDESLEEAVLRQEEEDRLAAAAAAAAAAASEGAWSLPAADRPTNTSHLSEASGGPSPSSPSRRISLGDVAPHWIPDQEAASCMCCDTKFTLVKRRHHCRACGKVLCNACCAHRHALKYLDDEKAARVCEACKQILERQEAEAAATPTRQPPGVLKKNSLDQGVGGASGAAASSPSSEGKSVMFSDGVRPGGDLTELDGSSSPSRHASSSSRRKGSKSRSRHAVVVPHEEAGAGRSLLPLNREEVPLVVGEGRGGSGVKAETEEVAKMLQRGDTVAFVVNNNLTVKVKLVFYEPANKMVWNYCSNGLLGVGQDELVILLAAEGTGGGDDRGVPRWDVFNHFQFLYERAKTGPPVVPMGYSTFANPGEPFLGSDNSYGGFFYVKSNFQSLENLVVPPAGTPFLFGLLITKWELPWARLFPLRLMLRLGAEFRYYPAPLWSERDRATVYNDVGNTMMKILCDFRNYAYSLPIIGGLRIHMEKKLTKVFLPKDSYNSLHRALTNSNQPVLALGAVFSKEADSHLVAIQRGDEDDQQSQYLGISQSDYETQAINIANKERVVTGASFIVFNGVLKASSGLTAKSSIVEDGLMVQISQERMVELRKSLEKLEDFQIDCGPVDADEPDETICITWTNDTSDVNEGVTSHVDLMKLDGFTSVRLHSRRDFTSRGSSYFVRWTEVFFLSNTSDLEPSDQMGTASGLAKAVCVAMSPHLEKLRKANMTTIAIRITLDPEKVSYDAGSSGIPLPPALMKALDDTLIPLISYEAGNLKSCLELLFKILNC